MATKSEIIDAIEALAVHCRAPLMSVEQRALWMRDWCDDLGGYPAEAIQAACRAYRHSGQAKFPTSGHLLPLVRQNMPADKAEAGSSGPWRPLSDAEYEALDLRAKIRHRLILASEARSKAGPMFRNSPGVGIRTGGQHLTVEDMPATWRRWTEIAHNHVAEATRLRSYLRAKPAMAAE